MSRISSGMDLMILGVLLLLTSGAVFAYQVENGTLGGSVYFYESVPIQDTPAIQWICRDAIVAQRFPGLTPVCVGQYIGRCELYENGTLRLDHLTSADEGSYVMTAQYPNSTIIKKSTFDLRVYTPVSDVKITSSVPGLVWPGIDSVSLTCSANGTGITYSWNLQGVPLPNVSRYHLTENNRVLTITPVTVNDTGTFTCTAFSIINSQTSNGINLTLGSKISEVALTSNISEGHYLFVGEESAFLHCYADGSNVTFIWKLNGEKIPQGPPYYESEGESPSHSNLFISPVSKTDAGPFTCEASNRLGNQTSNDLNFSLAWKPEGNINCSALPDGGGIKLGCSWPGGHPAANVTLDFNGRTEKGMNNVTSLVSIDGNFQGSNLTCHGDQLGRKSQCTVNIRRPEAPEHKNDTITNTKVGEKLNLTVTLEPGLPATFNWHRIPSNQSKAQAEISSTNFSSSYLIQDVTASDGGEYVCTAENIIGTQSFRFTVKVEKQLVPTPVKDGLSGGAIAGIVIGVLAGVALIGIAVFFIVKKKKRSGDNKRINEPDDQLGTNVTYATVQKPTAGVAETSLTNNQQEDDVKYAVLKFPNNNSTMATVPPPVETEYSTVKTSIKP